MNENQDFQQWSTLSNTLLVFLLYVVTGSMTLSYASPNFIYESPTEAKILYSSGYKIRILRDGVLVRESKVDGIFNDKFERGAHTYTFEYYRCDRWDASGCEIETLSSTETIKLSGNTNGYLTTSKRLSGEHHIQNLYLCNGTQLTVEAGASIHNAANNSSGFIKSGTNWGMCSNTRTAPPPKLVIDRATLENISISQGQYDDPIEISVTNSKFKNGNSISNVTFSKFSGNTCENCSSGEFRVNYCRFPISGTATINNNQIPNMLFSVLMKDGASVFLRNNSFGTIGTSMDSSTPTGTANIYVTNNSVTDQIAVSSVTKGRVNILNNTAKFIKVDSIGDDAELYVNGNTSSYIQLLEGSTKVLNCVQKPINKIISNNIFNASQKTYSATDATIDNTNNGMIIEMSGIRVIRNTITTDMINGNKYTGIWAYSKCYNEIIGNHISNYNTGIELGNVYSLISGYSLIRDNIVHGKETAIKDQSFRVGEYPTEAQKHRIFNNIFLHDSTSWYPLVYPGSKSIWNTNKTAGPNIIGGPFIGGNYYSDWIGTDENKDGFTDMPRVIYEDSFAQPPAVIKDNLPLYAQLTVNRATDEEDANVADGKCDIDTSTAGDQCTLRAVIQTTNAQAGENTVIFNIPGTPLIQVTKPLPSITRKVILNANTQPNVVVNGTGAGDGVSGLQINAADTKIMGLTIRGFSKSGIKSNTDLILSGVTTDDNGAYGVYLTNGNLTFSNDALTANLVKNNKFGGIRVENGIMYGKKKLEVTGNGIAKGSAGHGIYAVDTIGADDGFAIKFEASESLIVSQNAGHGITGRGEIQLDGTAITVSDNGHYGVYAMSHGDIRIGTDSTSGSTVDISNNKNGWGIRAPNGDIFIGREDKVTTVVKNNAYGGIAADKGAMYARKLEVTGNGAAKGDKGHGIYMGSVDVNGISAWISEGAIVSQNVGNGITVFGGIKLEGKDIAVSNNGKYGIYAKGDIFINNTIFVPTGSIADISGNKGGWGIFSQSGNISIGSESRTTASVNKNANGGILANAGSITARILNVISNYGVGIRTPSDLNIMISGKICNNTGGNFLVGGITTVAKVIPCD